MLSGSIRQRLENQLTASSLRSYVYGGHTFNYLLDKALKRYCVFLLQLRPRLPWQDLIFLCIAAPTATELARALSRRDAWRLTVHCLRVQTSKPSAHLARSSNSWMSSDGPSRQSCWWYWVFVFGWHTRIWIKLGFLLSKVRSQLHELPRRDMPLESQRKSNKSYRCKLFPLIKLRLWREEAIAKWNWQGEDEDQSKSVADCFCMFLRFLAKSEKCDKGQWAVRDDSVWGMQQTSGEGTEHQHHQKVKHFRLRLRVSVEASMRSLYCWTV